MKNVRKHLIHVIKEEVVARNTKTGKPIVKEGKVQKITIERLEYASEAAKRIGVTSRTISKARQGRQSALQRVVDALGQ